MAGTGRRALCTAILTIVQQKWPFPFNSPHGGSGGLGSRSTNQIRCQISLQMAIAGLHIYSRAAILGIPFLVTQMKGNTPPGFPVLDTVTTTLNFFDARQPESNFRWTGSNESERPMNYTPPDPHEVVIHDLRGLSPAQREEMGLTVEKAGFEYVQGWGSGGKEIEAAWEQGKWNDESWIQGAYYPYVKKYGSGRSLRLLTLNLFLYQDDQREIQCADSDNL